MSAAEESALLKNRADRRAAAQMLFEEAQKGAKALEAGDAAAYLGTIEAREKLIKRMNTLEARYAAVKDGAPEGARAGIDAAEAETRELLRRVLSLDESAREKAKTLMEEYRTKLKTLKKSGRQVTGYTKMYQQPDGIYIDKKR